MLRATYFPRKGLSTMNKRPGIITFVGILVFISAAAAAITSIAAFLGKGTDTALAAGLSDTTLLTTGIVEAILPVASPTIMTL